MDPYVYDNSTILINKLNIKDEQQLIAIEAQLLIAGLIDIDTIIEDINFDHYHSLQTIHHFLFETLYTWAGDFRTINIYKSEKVLNGLSITYSDHTKIQHDLQYIFNWAKQVTWSHQNPQLPSLFSKLMTDIWRVHPYREGNTRTVSIFMKLFAEKHDLSFNAELLSQNAGYLRNALVMAAVEEAPEDSYLQKIIVDALTSHHTDTSSQSKAQAKEKYEMIGNYHVAHYEEKPFETNKDKNR